MDERYPLQCFVPCWTGAAGFLAGVPVVAVVLRERGSVRCTLQEIVDRISEGMPPKGPARPRIIAVLGEEQWFDERLFMRIRYQFSIPVYAEYSGERPMTDRFGAFPKWDHVEVSLRHAKLAVSGGIVYNSIRVPIPTHGSDLIALAARIERGGFKVQKYATPSGRSDAYDVKVIREAAASGFRLSRPLSHEPLPA